VSIGETECTSLVSWTASNFIGEGALVFQGEDGEIFSDNLMEPLPPDGGVPRTVTVNNNTFTISDSDGSYNNSVRAEVNCDEGVGAWADGVCAPRPVINISAAQNLIRSGNVAVLNVQVDSDFVLDCNIEGGLNYSFVHDNSPTPISYPPITTGPLTSASVITITCASAVYPSIVSTEEVRVNVVPIVQER
jgi:hypothetical protein